MDCYQHPGQPASAFCRTCGRALCAEDQRKVHGIIYCEDCLGRMVHPTVPTAAGTVVNPAPAPPFTAPPPPLDNGAPNPGMALLLGFIPGVGAIYNGQYLKALFQVIVFASLIMLEGGALGVLFGLATAAFYFYMVVDSYRVARAMSLGQPVEDLPGLGQVSMPPFTGALILIALGVLLLLRSMDLFSFLTWAHVSRYAGPVLLIAAGVLWFLRQRPQPPASGETGSVA